FILSHEHIVSTIGGGGHCNVAKSKRIISKCSCDEKIPRSIGGTTIPVNYICTFTVRDPDFISGSIIFGNEKIICGTGCIGECIVSKRHYIRMEISCDEDIPVAVY